MIIICFGGGLGNQMFQYAFYLTMKKKYPSHVVKMDINNIMEEDHNGYELERLFGVPSDCCSTWKSVLHSLQYPRNKSFFKIGNKLLIWKRKLVKHPHHIRMDDGTRYDMLVDQIPAKGTWLLEGYWTNVKYYETVADELPRLFQFPPFAPEDRKNMELAEQMASCNSVSVHVRRGDYAAAGLSVLGSAYYREAMRRMKVQVTQPVFFIFSDEQPEVLEQFFDGDEQKVFVSHNRGDQSYRDMQLMSLCKHNIIANSTFSFWGAFLNQNPEKYVIAPDKVADKLAEGYVYPGWDVINVSKEE